MQVNPQYAFLLFFEAFLCAKFEEVTIEKLNINENQAMGSTIDPLEDKEGNLRGKTDCGYLSRMENRSGKIKIDVGGEGLADFLNNETEANHMFDELAKGDDENQPSNNFHLEGQSSSKLIDKLALIAVIATEEAFEMLKFTMSTTLMLALPDFTKDFVVETDTCYGEIGVVLMQDKRPLAYLNKALNQRNLGLSIYEKEWLALVTAVSKWRHYLEGHHFIIKTDHHNLKHLLEQRITTLCSKNG
ncbi:hypothetical protein ACH5RR_034046 [Cinchona calisaya]|uniref:Reverse transcriptase RNase H-like domain-containing protein n=1 Tax=Cinchona calisaya TaxID=153742 RepID=A0ABD2YED2_9GENT